MRHIDLPLTHQQYLTIWTPPEAHGDGWSRLEHHLRHDRPVVHAPDDDAVVALQPCRMRTEQANVAVFIVIVCFRISPPTDLEVSQAVSAEDAPVLRCTCLTGPKPRS